MKKFLLATFVLAAAFFSVNFPSTTDAASFVKKIIVPRDQFTSSTGIRLSSGILVGNKLYVPVGSSSGVAVIDVNSDTFLKAIPYNKAYAANSRTLIGSKIYFTSQNSIDVLDTTTDTIVSSYSDGNITALGALTLVAPNIAYAPSGQGVMVFNTSTNKIESKIPRIKAKTYSTAVYGSYGASYLSGNKFYAVNVDGYGGIDVFDTSTNEFVMTINKGTAYNYAGAPVLNGDKLYAIRYGSSKYVDIINTNTNTVSDSIKLAYDLRPSITVIGNKLFALPYSSGHIDVYDLTTKQLVAQIPNVNGYSGAVGTLVGNNLYLPSYSKTVVDVVDVVNNKLITSINTASNYYDSATLVGTKLYVPSFNTVIDVIDTVGDSTGIVAVPYSDPVLLSEVPQTNPIPSNTYKFDPVNGIKNVPIYNFSLNSKSERSDIEHIFFGYNNLIGTIPTDFHLYVGSSTLINVKPRITPVSFVFDYINRSIPADTTESFTVTADFPGSGYSTSSVGIYLAGVSYRDKTRKSINLGGTTVTQSGSGGVSTSIPNPVGSYKGQTQYFVRNSSAVNSVATTTATLTVNGSHNVTVSPGDNLLFSWSSVNASSYSPNVVPSKTSCNGYDLALVFSLNGTYNGQAPQKPGCSYELTYTAGINGVPNSNSSDTVVINVKDQKPASLSAVIEKDPLGSNVYSIDPYDTTTVPLYSFKLKSQDGNSTITSISLNVLSESGTHTSPKTLYLYDGSTLLSSKTVSDRFVVFNNLNYVVGSDVTKMFTVKGDFPTNTVSTSTASLSVSGITYKISNGTTPYMGILPLAGQTQYLVKKGSVSEETNSTPCTSPIPTFSVNATVGDSNDVVHNLKCFLSSKGYLLGNYLNNYYGDKTKAALATYQVSKGITPNDGVNFGPITRAAVNADIASVVKPLPVVVTTTSATAPSIQTTTPVIPATPQPTASLTANDKSGDVTVYVNEPLTYKWTSTNANIFRSSYIGSPASCGSGDNWVASTTNGSSYTASLPTSFANCTYNITYSVSNEKSPICATSAFLKLRVLERPKVVVPSTTVAPAPVVNPPVSSAPTPSVATTTNPTASLTVTVNGQMYTGSVNVKVGDVLNYEWSSTNADIGQSLYSSQKCGTGLWTAKDTGNKWIVKLDSNQAAGCNYTILYVVTQKATGKTARAELKVNVAPMTTSLNSKNSNKNTASVTNTLNWIVGSIKGIFK